MNSNFGFSLDSNWGSSSNSKLEAKWVQMRREYEESDEEVQVGSITPVCEFWSIEKYIEKVKAEKSYIIGDALLPHEIISYANHWNFAQAAELQWKTMVEHFFSKQGNLNNCLAVCETALVYNCRHTIDTVVAWTLLLSELNEEPWKGKTINFSKIDFQRVFDLILQEAVNANLKPERWDKAHPAIQGEFKKGYEHAVPKIVYWIMQDGKPRRWMEPCTYPGVTVLNGFSDDLLRLFLDNDGEIRPNFGMEAAAIEGEGYRKLVVLE
ncbi:hypothetical protein D8674_028571 [Pyrus ussuriensis x Pyrus communis]|uniref:DUF7788 domain-containing protein n=1 Tax=Pyrus ussuriensis x Pyrus communis TaxID=2448454 RepID=A0A5N5IA26_9ROSA|nr:hypothetical protein D8674_028571 [Pyrus ussuriensis x Pyrus communis]